MPIADAFDCGVHLGCGNETWLVTNTVLSSYVTGGTCGDALSTPFSALTATICTCPPAGDISPCGCELMTDSSTPTVNVTCSGFGLDDKAMANILMNISATVPVRTFILSRNALTKVPSQLSYLSRVADGWTSSSLLAQFPLLDHIDLSHNALKSVLAGDLTIKAPLLLLDLTFNNINSIEASSMPSKLLLISLIIFFS